MIITLVMRRWRQVDGHLGLVDYSKREEGDHGVLGYLLLNSHTQGYGDPGKRQADL